LLLNRGEVKQQLERLLLIRSSLGQGEHVSAAVRERLAGWSSRGLCKQRGARVEKHLRGGDRRAVLVDDDSAESKAILDRRACRSSRDDDGKHTQKSSD